MYVRSGLSARAGQAGRSRHPDGMGDGRTVLLGWLAWPRATVHRKCRGPDDELARRTVRTGSSTSAFAVVSHLSWNERHWFERSFLGHEAEGQPPPVAASAGWDGHAANSPTLANPIHVATPGRGGSSVLDTGAVWSSLSVTASASWHARNSRARFIRPRRVGGSGRSSG